MAQKRNVKIWTATENSQAGFMVQEESATMLADRSNFICATKNGVVIAGKSIATATTSENIRSGGLFVKMNDFVQLIPTTIVTPMPAQIPFPPLGMITSVLKDMAFMTAMVAATAASSR